MSGRKTAAQSGFQFLKGLRKDCAPCRGNEQPAHRDLCPCGAAAPLVAQTFGERPFRLAPVGTSLGGLAHRCAAAGTPVAEVPVEHMPVHSSNPGRKKVAALLGSRRKGNTYGILKQLQQELSPFRIDVEIFNVYDFTVDDCIGCERCIRGKKCGQKDEVDVFWDPFVQADGLIFASPVYLDSVSGRMKTFLDRKCAWFHRPALVGKPMLSVATTSGSGLRATLNYIDDVALRYGAFPTGQIGRDVQGLDRPVARREYQRFAEYLMIDRGQHEPSLKQLLNFQVQRILATHVSAVDHAYWSERNWLQRLYYYDCRIPLAKRAAASAFFHHLAPKIRQASLLSEARGDRTLQRPADSPVARPTLVQLARKSLAQFGVANDQARPRVASAGE